jgi:ribosomal protein L40E
MSQGDIFRYKNWHEGDPCPKCGSNELKRIITYEDIVKSKEQIFETMDDRYLDILDDPVHTKYICNECNTKLYEFP